MAKKLSELDKVVKSIEKDMGVGTVLDGDKLRGFHHLDTDSFLLNYALLGGVTEGNGTMIYGNESTGKTTMCYKVIAGHQRKYLGRGDGETAVLVDLEAKYDADWAEKMGVDIEKLKVIRPGMGEEAVDCIEAVMRAKEVGIVVMDSIAAILPKVILDNSAEDQTMGRRAALVGLLCSKLQQAWIDERKRGHSPTFICTNQWRESMKVMGDPRTLPGGKYQNFMVNTKFEILCKKIMGARDEDGKITTKIATKGDGVKRLLANTHTFKFPKQKHGFSITEGVFDMVMDDPNHPQGLTTGWVDDARVAATFGKKDGFITGGGGAFRVLESESKFATLDDIADYLYSEPEVFTTLKQAIIGKKRMENGLPAFPRDNYLMDWK